MGQIFKTGKDRYDAFGHFGGQAYYYIEEYRLMKQVNLESVIIFAFNEEKANHKLAKVRGHQIDYSDGWK